ncbi:MAG: zinc-dependent peptidase [Bacteroidota bacterium]
MVTVLQIFFVLVLIIILILFVFKTRRQNETIPLPENYRELLTDYVKFYRQLNEEGKLLFDKRVEQFLAAVQITGVNAIVEDLDRLLIAAGAIIPCIRFPTGNISTCMKFYYTPVPSIWILTRKDRIVLWQAW